MLLHQKYNKNTNVSDFRELSSLQKGIAINFTCLSKKIGCFDVPKIKISDLLGLRLK